MYSLVHYPPIIDQFVLSHLVSFYKEAGSNPTDVLLVARAIICHHLCLALPFLE